MRVDRFAIPLLLATLTAACGIDSESGSAPLFGPDGGGTAGKGGAAGKSGSGSSEKGGAGGSGSTEKGGTGGASGTGAKGGSGGSAGSVSKGGSAGTTSKGGSGGTTAGTGGLDAGGSDAGGSDAGGASAGGTDAGGANAGGTEAGGANAGGTDAGGANAGGTDAGGANAGGDAGAPSAGNGGSSNAGNGGATSAGNGGATSAGNGGATSAGNGGATSAGNGGATSAGNGGATSAGNGGAGGVVEPPPCGNGKVDPGEECDPKATATDVLGCGQDCKVLCDAPGIAFRDTTTKTCYFRIEGDWDWNGARDICKSVGKGRLATFEVEETRIRVKEGFQPGGAVYWVGARQEKDCCFNSPGADWKWKTGGSEPDIDKPSWTGGEPNDAGLGEFGDEDCGEALGGDGFKMNDTSCGTKHAALCQRALP